MLAKTPDIFRMNVKVSVEIQDHEALVQENTQNCWNVGYEDGKADVPDLLDHKFM